MIVVDSSVWIDYLAHGANTAETDWLDRLLGSDLVTVGDLILCEVLQGFKDQQEFEAARDMLLSFECVSLLNPRLAVNAAENHRVLRRRGITVRKTPDLIIATFCIESGRALLHRDRDFDPFEEHLGLIVVR